MKSISGKWLVLLVAGAMLASAPGCGRKNHGVELIDASAKGSTESTESSQVDIEGSQDSSADSGEALTGSPGTSSESPFGEKTAAGQELNILDVLKHLDKREDELGLSGIYGSVLDINSGQIAPELLGEWISADGSQSYSFSAEGVLRTRHDLYGTKTETQFTTINIEGTDIIAYDAISISLSDMDGDVQTGTEIAYYAYYIENDTLYMADVESINETYTSYVSTLQILYKTGGDDASSMKNPVAPASLYGSWDAEGVKLVIDENGFMMDGTMYSFSFDGRGRLILEKDGASFAYSFYLSHQKNYETSDRSKPSDQKYLLSIYYDGTGEEDIPNLSDYLIDWKNEYGWEAWHYTLNLSRPDTDV